MKKWDLTEMETRNLKVIKHQNAQLTMLDDKLDSLLMSNPALQRNEELLKKFRKTLPVVNRVVNSGGRENSVIAVRSYEEIVAEAEREISESISFEDILSSGEIESVEQRLANWKFEFNQLNKLDSVDWCICGVSGIVAAMVDILLIQMPKHPGFLGGEVSSGGPLSNWIREKVNGSLSPAEVRNLEKKFWVPYDPATSQKLDIEVSGLGPGTHRFQSLGHDPILGFIFGVKDILQGTFTAINKKGELISQTVATPEMGVGLFEAIGKVFGHLQSDVTTARGLPVPLMPLLQLIQAGSIGKGEYTIGEISRSMYRSGYDFRHFLAMSVSPMLIEIVVRLCYAFKRRNEGNEWGKCIPFDLVGDRKPKLQTMLFTSHLIASAANAGKVYFTGNPLAINSSQWMLFTKYAFSQLKWALADKENERQAYVQKQIDNDWNLLNNELSVTWSKVMCDSVALKGVKC